MKDSLYWPALAKILLEHFQMCNTVLDSEMLDPNCI